MIVKVTAGSLKNNPSPNAVDRLSPENAAMQNEP